jgi:uncharacterized membrane protein
MGLVLCNHYPRTISTVIMFYSPDSCGGEGGDFEQMGWWNIEPGACALVYANDLEDLNRYWFYYAISFSDGAFWAGDLQSQVPLDAFSLCWNIGISGPPMKQIGYRELDIGDNDDYTLNFIA